jgi:hypothetical protein
VLGDLKLYYDNPGVVHDLDCGFDGLSWVNWKLNFIICFVFYKGITVLNKSLGIELILDFASIYFCYHIIK